MPTQRLTSERPPPRRALIIQTAYLGDTVFTSALAAAFRKRWPECELELCVSPRGRDVALAMPGVTAAHVFDKRGADKGFSGLKRMAARLRERGFDLAILPHRSLRTGLLARLAGIPERIGFAGAAGSLFYTQRVRSTAKGFLAQEADLARAVDAQPAEMLLQPRPEWLHEAREALGSCGNEKLAAICLGSEWATKIWPAERVTGLLRLLTRGDLRPVLLGGPRERELAARIARAGGACVDTTGNPVGEALAILSMSSLCVGGDTGLVHAARALGVPTVAVFGPTDPGMHVFGPRQRAVSLQLACAPCSAHGSAKCPLGHHRCLRDLPPEKVEQACQAVLLT